MLKNRGLRMARECGGGKPRNPQCAVTSAQDSQGPCVELNWTIDMSDQIKRGTGSSPERLSEMLGLEPDNARLWRPEELAAVFRHQMAAPVSFDLGGADDALAKKLRLLTDAQGLLVKSFADLFGHPCPPLELLRLTKDFAKANRDHPEALLPREIANALYFGSIAAALVRCKKRISKLTNAEMRQGFSWAASQPWVDAPLKGLLDEALAGLPSASGV
mgnify:CR=1 FL=1